MKTIKSTKRFVHNHKTALIVTATSTAWIALMMRNAKELNAFLAEHNLLDEYYQPEA